MTELATWGSFYSILGSAAGALIGLQFVVMTLIAERPKLGTPEAGAAFASPTIVHFGTVLFLSASLRAPWQTMTPLAALWGLVGLAGVAYTVIVAQRVRSQTTYRPELEDWLFHVLLPAAAYATLGLSAVAAQAHTRVASFGVATGVLILLFTAIHNAWDAVAYHVFVSARDAKE